MADPITNWNPDTGTGGLDAVPKQFLTAVKQVSSEVGVDWEAVRYNVYDTNPGEFLFTSNGRSAMRNVEFDFYAKWITEDFYEKGTKPSIRTGIEINFDHTRFELDQDLTSMVNHTNYLIRWAGWAIHCYNLEHHPVNLETCLGQNLIHLYGAPRERYPTMTEFRLLMMGLKSGNTKVNVLKFRHVDSGNWYRSYSYGIWAQDSPDGEGLWVFFCRAAGLDSGGWYGNYTEIEKLIQDLGDNATVLNYDIRLKDLEPFLFKRSIESSEFYSLYAPKSATVETPEYLFDVFVSHPEITKVSKQLFGEGHYPQSIFEACKALNKLVQSKSGRGDLDGRELMSTVFKLTNPILALNTIRNQSERDEQEGFMFLYMGAMEGIRNPGAHEIQQLRDPRRALEYLGLISLLARRVDEASKVEHT